MKNEIITPEIVKILSEIQASSSGLYRSFLTKKEIKICNYLVKQDLLYKAKPDERNATIAFYITGKGSKYLENKN
jgi:hypothetical protein